MAERRGRAAGYLALGLLVSAFTAFCTVEIITQAWAEPANPPNVSCRDGLRGLLTALDRARAVAGREGHDTRDAVFSFRAALAPQWDHHESVRRRCATSQVTEKAYRQIAQLRFAEEHAVRYQASDLSEHRRRVNKMKNALGLHPPEVGPPPRTTEGN
jgi:hypothetical protein